MSYQILAEKGFPLLAEIFLRSKHKHYVKDTTHDQIRLTDEYPTWKKLSTNLFPLVTDFIIGGGP